MKKDYKIFVSILSFGVGICFCLNAYSQQITMQKLDMELTQDFRKMISEAFGDDYDRFDSLTRSFKSRLEKDLATKTSFDCKFDSLSKEILIIQSEDKLLKIFSWDELSGGTWHDMASFAQFKTTSGNVLARQLDTDREAELGMYTDVIISKVHDITIRNKTYYLTIGWGTHGAGHHHMTAQVFGIEGEKLVKCTNCFESGEELVVIAARSYKINLRYNTAAKEITYSEFKEDGYGGFYQPTGKVITLRLKNNKFVK